MLFIYFNFSLKQHAYNDAAGWEALLIFFSEGIKPGEYPS